MVGADALTVTAEVDDDEAAEPVATTTTTSLDQALATSRALSSETVTAAEPVHRPGCSHDRASDDAPTTIASTPSERRDSHDEILGTVYVRPHRRTAYVDAVYCYSWSSVFCRSVCHDREPCKNG